ncbi:hypothetical protein [Halomarina pelagica]|uniref:hypothetical protein n=1 Tax=Halomarina pelagica TaxID=2961599 RepID=UPI0020C562E1|nr:hypothetical protein [Halomarina sp. BND7]
MTSARLPRHERIYQNALDVRDRTYNHANFVEYLTKHGATVSTQRTVDALPNRDSTITLANESNGSDATTTQNGGVTTQKIDTDEITGDITLTRFHGGGQVDTYVDYYFDIETHQFAGEGNADHIGVGWNDDHYLIVDYTWYCNDSRHIGFEESEPNGFDHWFNDKWAITTNTTWYGYVGCRIEELSTSQERYVRGEYLHTWNSASLASFGVSPSGGINFNVNNSSSSWEGAYATVRESDADDVWCC